jgi:hypothetical protein
VSFIGKKQKERVALYKCFHMGFFIHICGSLWRNFLTYMGLLKDIHIHLINHFVHRSYERVDLPKFAYIFFSLSGTLSLLQ